MRRLLAKALLAGCGIAAPLWALGQTPPPPVIAPPPAPAAHADGQKTVPLWQRDGNALSLVANSGDAATAPSGVAANAQGNTRFTGAGVRLVTRPGITAHAGVRTIRWAPLVPACAASLPGMPAGPACFDDYRAGMQRGEIGAGFAGRDVKLDLSVGQSQSEPAAARPRTPPALLPRVLPAEGGADVAAPLWFRDSTSTDISARGQLRVAPDTRLQMGASVGRVRFLPGSGLGADDSLDQTTLSFGVQHGAVRGTIVGHILEPNLPGAALDRNQRWSWSGIDLGISVRLPWRGELNFGAQNVWSSGRAPLLFGPAGNAPAQGRVPYVQYHQDL